MSQILESDFYKAMIAATPPIQPLVEPDTSQPVEVGNPPASAAPVESASDGALEGPEAFFGLEGPASAEGSGAVSSDGAALAAGAAIDVEGGATTESEAMSYKSYGDGDGSDALMPSSPPIDLLAAQGISALNMIEEEGAAGEFYNVEEHEAAIRVQSHMRGQVKHGQ